MSKVRYSSSISEMLNSLKQHDGVSVLHLIMCDNLLLKRRRPKAN